ncbi:MAG TPA: methionine adenosyltransferase [Candidatus Cloacimonadota bacterium]|nr:methionine adenosyltransferase [Candidatus Cloacimonadota bacterium]HPT72820.1 methionine adenosyltransferase [Candidatus Cloacimonadota bacterium]
MVKHHEDEAKLEFLFTSESVSEGHPDKVCDMISDAILDAYIAEDPKSRVACETLATTDKLIISGEITSQASFTQEKISEIVRNTIRKIGYTKKHKGFDDNCEIINLLHEQEGALRDNSSTDNPGAGDQGLMFGYACDHTSQLMPIPIVLSHVLVQNLAKVRKNGQIPELMPDSKSQCTFRFIDRNPVELMNIVISTQHEKMDAEQFEAMKKKIEELVVNPSIEQVRKESKYDFSYTNVNKMINPLGMWEDGGPAADTGLTGRKIIVDSYGGWARHGGGAFSGKDSTKVDRSACYMARHIAKSVVASKLASECEIQLSFVIGQHEPVAVMVDTFGTNQIHEREIEAKIRANFNLSVKGIIEYLDLRKPIYNNTSAYGHFGRTDVNFSWETTKTLS